MRRGIESVLHRESMPACCSGTKEPDAQPAGVLAGPALIDDMIFEILRQGFTSVKALLEPGMCDVPCHDNPACQREAGRDRVFRKSGEQIFHWLFKVNLHTALSFITCRLGQEPCQDQTPVSPRKIPSLVTFPLMFLWALQLKPRPMGHEAPCLGSLITPYVQAKIFAAELPTQP